MVHCFCSYVKGAFTWMISTLAWDYVSCASASHCVALFQFSLFKQFCLHNILLCTVEKRALLNKLESNGSVAWTTLERSLDMKYSYFHCRPIICEIQKKAKPFISHMVNNSNHYILGTDKGAGTSCKQKFSSALIWNPKTRRIYASAE